MFTRTIFMVSYKVYTVGFENGKPVLQEIKTVDNQPLSAKPKEDAILRKERKENPLPNIIIGDLVVTEEVYGISLEDFMEHAVRQERPASQSKNKKENE